MTVNEYFTKLVDYGFFDLTHDPKNTAEHYWWYHFIEDCMTPEPKEIIKYEKHTDQTRSLGGFKYDLEDDYED